jgi:hypothetical protein
MWVIFIVVVTIIATAAATNAFVVLLVSHSCGGQ